jgi:hypothetical protein
VVTTGGQAVDLHDSPWRRLYTWCSPSGRCQGGSCRHPVISPALVLSALSTPVSGLLSSPPPEAAKVIDAYPDQERHTQPHQGRIGEHRRAGLNLAVDLRRLGAVFPLGLAGVVGHDAHGWLVRDACAALGIDTIPLPKVPDVATSSTDAMVCSRRRAGHACCRQHGRWARVESCEDARSPLMRQANPASVPSGRPRSARVRPATPVSAWGSAT